MAGRVPLDENAIRSLLHASGIQHDEQLVRDLLRTAPKLSEWSDLNRKGEDLFDEPAVTFDLPLRGRPA